MITVPVPLPDRSYQVHIGVVAPDAAADILAPALGRPTGVAVLVDGQLATRSPRVGQLVSALSARLPGVRQYALPAGESCKNLAAVERTCQWLAEQGYDRGAAVVGIGGGAASDHAGFVAAVYLRGIEFALCSTTLLGMVDASVGGKTGVDLPAGKNLVGAFHQPRAVVADLGFLETLPRREIAAGMAEVVKAGPDRRPGAAGAGGGRRRRRSGVHARGAWAFGGRGGAGEGRRGDRRRARGGPAGHPELRAHHRPRAGGGVGLRPAARRGGVAGHDCRAGVRRGPRASATRRCGRAPPRCWRGWGCRWTSPAG